MTTMHNNEVFIKKSFNISHKLETLINNFSFSTHPKDGIKKVKLKAIKISSLSSSQNLTFEINDNKSSILDAIKAHNISTRKLVIKEISLDVIFCDGFFDKKKKSQLVEIKYFNQNKTKNTNPIIDKYLESWGLIKAIAA